MLGSGGAVLQTSAIVARALTRSSQAGAEELKQDPGRASDIQEYIAEPCDWSSDLVERPCYGPGLRLVRRRASHRLTPTLCAIACSKSCLSRVLVTDYHSIGCHTTRTRAMYRNLVRRAMWRRKPVQGTTKAAAQGLPAHRRQMMHASPASVAFQTTSAQQHHVLEVSS